nr:unnamed protein product [Digitaria exilis]
MEAHTSASPLFLHLHPPSSPFARTEPPPVLDPTGRPSADTLAAAPLVALSLFFNPSTTSIALSGSDPLPHPPPAPGSGSPPATPHHGDRFHRRPPVVVGADLLLRAEIRLILHLVPGSVCVLLAFGTRYVVLWDVVVWL